MRASSGSVLFAKSAIFVLSASGLKSPTYILKHMQVCMLDKSQVKNLTSPITHHVLSYHGEIKC